jgi:AcrR family transcriptional regulator
MADNVKTMVEDKDPELVAKRRTQLVEAAIELFSRVGYHGATVKDVADEAGVSAGLVYQYVPDKQDLLFLCILHIVQRNKQEIPAALEGIDDPLQRLNAAVDAYSRVIAANQHAVLLTYRETKSLKREYIEVMKRMELETNALIANCIDECIRSRHMVATNVELLVYRIITGAHAWALKHWRLPKIVSLDEYLQQSIHSCWTVFLTAKGKRRYAELRLEDARKPMSSPRNSNNDDKKKPVTSRERRRMSAGVAAAN